MTENGKKPAYKSLTLQGLLVLAVSWVLGKFDLAGGGNAENIAEGLVAVIGVFMSVYGRLRKGDLDLGDRGGKAAPALLMIVPAVLLGGCSNPPLNVADKQSGRSEVTGAAAGYMDAEGVQTASYPGVPPSFLKQDAQGTWITTPGEGAVVTFDPSTGKGYVWSPKDTEIEELTLTPNPKPGQPKVRLKGVKANMSNVAEVRAEQFASAVDAMKAMSEDEAKRYVQSLVEARKISEEAAGVLRELIPLLTGG